MAIDRAARRASQLPVDLGLVLLLTGFHPGIARSGYAEQYAHLTQKQQKTGAARRKERQADAGIGQQSGGHTNVAEHLPGHLGRNADAQQGAKKVRRIEGDFYNVMGLPLCTLCEMLEEIGAGA